MKKGIILLAFGLCASSLIGCGKSEPKKAEPEQIVEEEKVEVDAVTPNLPTKDTILKDLRTKRVNTVTKNTFIDGVILDPAFMPDGLFYDGYVAAMGTNGFMGVYNSSLMTWLLAPIIEPEWFNSVSNIFEEIGDENFNEEGFDDKFASLILINVSEERTVILDNLGNCWYDGEPRNSANFKLTSTIEHLEYDEIEYKNNEIRVATLLDKVSKTEKRYYYKDSRLVEYIEPEEDIIENVSKATARPLNLEGKEKWTYDFSSISVLQVRDETGKVQSQVKTYIDTTYVNVEPAVFGGYLYYQNIYPTDTRLDNYTVLVEGDGYFIEDVLVDIFTGEKTIREAKFVVEQRVTPINDADGYQNYLYFEGSEIINYQLHSGSFRTIIDANLNIIDECPAFCLPQLTKLGDYYLDPRNHIILDKDLNISLNLKVFNDIDFINNGQYIIGDFDMGYGICDLSGNVIEPFSHEQILCSIEGTHYLTFDADKLVYKTMLGEVVETFEGEDLEILTSFNDLKDGIGKFKVNGKEYTVDTFGNVSIKPTNVKAAFKISNEACGSLNGYSLNNFLYNTPLATIVTIGSYELKPQVYGTSSEEVCDGLTVYTGFRLALDTEQSITKTEKTTYFRFTAPETNSYKLVLDNLTVNTVSTMSMTDQEIYSDLENGEELILKGGVTYLITATHKTPTLDGKFKMTIGTPLEVIPDEGLKVEFGAEELQKQVTTKFTAPEDGAYRFGSKEDKITYGGFVYGVINAPAPIMVKDTNILELTKGTEIIALYTVNKDKPVIDKPVLADGSEYLEVTNADTKPWAYDEKTKTYTSTAKENNNDTTLTFTTYLPNNGFTHKFVCDIETSTEYDYDYLKITFNGNTITVNDKSEFSGLSSESISIVLPSDQLVTITFTYHKDQSSGELKDEVKVINPRVVTLY